MTKKAKAWIIVGSIAIGVIAIVGIVLLVLNLSVSKEDYTKAAASAENITKQTEAFNKAGQAYANAGLAKVDDARLKELAAGMDTSLTSLLAGHNDLSKSPALRNVEVKQAYDAYNKKATVFQGIATGYNTSIPLYVTMMNTCSKIGADTDIFAQIKELTAFLAGFTKEQALERFDTKSSGCIEAASTLDKSGEDSFAKVGGVFFTSLTNTRKAIVARYDEQATLGRDKAELNYVRANSASEIAAEKALKEASALQKKEGEEGDYTAELKQLTQILKDKS